MIIHPSAHDRGSDFLFMFCAFGIIASLTCYGIILEYVTADGRMLDEISFLFITATTATIASYLARWVSGETHNEGSRMEMFALSVTSMASMYTSLRSLRYVIFPMQVLFHACKPVPVILFGNCFGKTYHAQKYLYVFSVISGVVLFIGGDPSKSKAGVDGSSQSSMIGVIMLLLSTCLEGGTSAYEEKLMSKQQVTQL